ncbi:MAG TPA: GH25 family lysozyme [Segetibacter sp.]|jgi:lysozyme
MAKRRKRKSKNNKRLWWIMAPILFVVVAVGAFFIYKYVRVEESKFARYGAFEIDLPSDYEVHGIDVSRYQSFIHWPAVKSMQVRNVTIGFAFIKATEGVEGVDRQFKRNWRKAGEADMPKGAYHFFLAHKSGKAQAENFIKTVKLKTGDLPPVLDIEQLYGVKPAQMRKQIKEWLQVVEDYYEVKPIIYTSVSFYDDYLGDEFDEYPLWIAHYKERNRPRIKRSWIFWQHNEEGRVNGITSKVDFNVFNGDSSDFEELLIR